MRRPMLAFTTTALAAALVFLDTGPSVAAPSSVAAPKAAAVAGWQDVTCVNGPNNGPFIQQALVTNNVRLYGQCTVDWTRPTPENPWLKGILIPNDRTLEITANAVVSLNPNQALIPTDPKTGLPSTQYGDIIRTMNAPAWGVHITGAGAIEGNGAQQGGNGFDGIQLQSASGSSVSDIRIRNIRGINALGGHTESFAVNVLYSVGFNAVTNVTVTTTGGNPNNPYDPNYPNRQASSSGIATNYGAYVRIDDSTVSHLRGRCFTSYETDNVIREGNFGDHCDAGAFGNEFGSFGTDSDNVYINSGYGLVLLGENDFEATNMFVAGNVQFAATHRNREPGEPAADPCHDILLEGDVYTGPYLGGNLGPTGTCVNFTNQLIDH